MRAGSPGPLVIVGDTLLDVDLHGTSDRVAPDAPVPVVDLGRQECRPGGAGLAALLAARAGAPVVLVTAIGADESGDLLLELLRHDVHVIAQPLRGSTVVKTRIRTADQPLLRVDSGSGVGGGADLTPEAVRALQGAGAVLVADYGRGLAWQAQLRRELARSVPGRSLVWDPHPRGARPVPGATLITPNQSEADRAAPGAPDPHTRGLDLCRSWDAAAVAVTVGEAGAVLTARGSRTSTTVPVPRLDDLDGSARVDPCGAGDRFSTAAAEALRTGADVGTAVETAVAAATRYVLTGGPAGLAGDHPSDLGLRRVVRPSVDLAELIRRTRRTGGRVVATGGCFDLLHRGHVNLLERARALGDLLVVCLNSDASVRRAKGPDRPVVAQEDRAEVLTALSAVDAVVVFDEDTPEQVLEQVRPDIWVKGSDYTDQPLAEADVVTRHGGRVVLLPIVSGYSTSRLVAAARTTPRRPTPPDPGGSDPGRADSGRADSGRADGDRAATGRPDTLEPDTIRALA